MIQHLASHVRPYRKRLGLTQAELGRIVCESNQSSIARYESGERYPPFEVSMALRHLFGVSVDRLFPKAAEEMLFQVRDHLTEAIERTAELEPSAKRSHKLGSLEKALSRIEAAIESGNV